MNDKKKRMMGGGASADISIDGAIVAYDVGLGSSDSGLSTLTNLAQSGFNGSSSATGHSIQGSGGARYMSISNGSSHIDTAFNTGDFGVSAYTIYMVWKRNKHDGTFMFLWGNQNYGVGWDNVFAIEDLGSMFFRMYVYNKNTSNGSYLNVDTGSSTSSAFNRYAWNFTAITFSNNSFARIYKCHNNGTVTLMAENTSPSGTRLYNTAHASRMFCNPTTTSSNPWYGEWSHLSFWNTAHSTTRIGQQFSSIKTRTSFSFDPW
tara:strand:+ start:155 stop:940 length:786 start_codon:yes stop_codon:yes gene_type:complete